MLRTDLAGNAAWNKTYLNYMINSVICTSDNSLVMTGQYFIPSPYARTFFIAKCDASGNTTWSIMLDPPSSMFYDAFGSDLKEKNGEYYFVGYASPPIPSEMIGKVTASGSVAWCLCFYTSFHPFNYTPATLDATADGGFVFARSLEQRQAFSPQHSSRPTPTETQVATERPTACQPTP